MPAEPPTKRAVALVDGPNLFRAAREAFGHTRPNDDVRALAGRVKQSVSAVTGVCVGAWADPQVRFRTGRPEMADGRA